MILKLVVENCKISNWNRRHVKEFKRKTYLISHYFIRHQITFKAIGSVFLLKLKNDKISVIFLGVSECQKNDRSG